MNEPLVPIVRESVVGLREDSPARILAVPLERYHELEALLQPAMDAALVSITRAFDAEGRPAILLGAGGNCGFCSIPDPGGGIQRLYFEVLPKIAGASWLRLAVLAGELRGVPASLHVTGERSLLLALAEAYARALEGVLHGGLRRMHRGHDKVLVGRVRGSIRLPALARGLARGRLLDVPCRFAVHDLDHLVNRALLCALDQLTHVCVEASGDPGSPTAALISLVRTFEGLRSSFVGVTPATVRGTDLARIDRLPATMRHYVASGALPLACWILERMMLGRGDDPRAARAFALSFNMASTFETAFFRAVRRSVPEALRQHSWRLEAGRIGTTIRPDALIQRREATLVLDTKWKFGEPSDIVSAPNGLDAMAGPGWQVKTTDFFQILTYAQRAALDAHAIRQRPHKVIGALVYPTTRTLSCSEIHWVLDGRRQDTGLRVVPWNVGEPFEEGLAHLRDELNALMQVGPAPAATFPTGP